LPHKILTGTEVAVIEMKDRNQAKKKKRKNIYFIVGISWKRGKKME